MDCYIYAADVYCVDCAKLIKAHLKSVGRMPKDVTDENKFDSNDWPKGPYADGGGEADSPQHCGSGRECINAMKVGKRGIGVWLGNPLTTEGEDYVLEQVTRNNGPVISFWAMVYREEIANAKMRNGKRTRRS